MKPGLFILCNTNTYVRLLSLCKRTGICIQDVYKRQPVVSRFIVNLPADNSGIIAIMYCQAGNDIFYIMTIAIATPGSVLTSSVLNGHSIIPLNQYVGIFFRQPDGRRGGRCTHEDVYKRQDIAFLIRQSLCQAEMQNSYAGQKELT